MATLAPAASCLAAANHWLLKPHLPHSGFSLNGWSKDPLFVAWAEKLEILYREGQKGLLVEADFSMVDSLR